MTGEPPRCDRCLNPYGDFMVRVTGTDEHDRAFDGVDYVCASCAERAHLNGEDVRHRDTPWGSDRAMT